MMAGEIKIPGITSGWTVYAIVRSAVGTVWQTTTATLVAYVTANRANYDIVLTEQGTASGVYVGDFPAATAGVYDIEAYRQTGGAPAEPTTDTYLGMERGFEWTGSVVHSSAITLPANIAAGASGGLLIAGSNAATTFAGLTTGALSCTTITASGAVAFQSTFAVTTSTNLAALSCSTFAASGTVTFNAFTVTNATTLSGAVSLGSTLGVTGTATFAAVTTTGTVTFNAFTVTGALTAGTNAIPWNAAWDTEVQSECDDALTAYGASTLTGAGVWAVGTRTLTSLAGLTVDTVTTLTNLPAITANWLTAAGTAADFGTEVGTAVWASTTRALTATGIDAITVETGLNARQALSIIASSAAGVLAGAATLEITIAAAGVAATNRITATVDSSGNRSAVTLSAPA